MRTLTFVALLSVAVLCFAQEPVPHPKPIPSLNFSRIEGQWYAIFAYDYFSVNVNESIPCFSMNFTIIGNKVQVNETYIFDNQTQKIVENAVITDQTSVWNFEGNNKVAWLSMDPVNYNYALMASMDRQHALLIARTQTLGLAVTNIQKALLKAEGYLLNSTNVLQIGGQCPTTTPVKISV